MSDRFRNKVISQLAEEINHLSGGSFEQFGYKVMPLIQPGRWMERGTTIDGASRKATVDTSLHSAAYVGEMSSVADYFGESLEKPKADLQHALRVHPQAECIWLLSARTATAGQTTAIENAVAEFKNAHPSVKTATILDARAIATEIFSHIASHDAVRDLSHYLPGLTKLAEEHAFSHSIPSIRQITPRHEVESRIEAALSSSSYVILQGMSGVGKTAIAARIAHRQKDNFDNCIWLDAREFDGVQKLRSVALTRSGVNHNIADLVRRERILLVIDDPAFPLSELADIEYGESRAIITTQVASGLHVVQIADLTRQESQSVLTADVPMPNNPLVVERILNTAGGHPLVLRALNRLASEHGWKEVEECLLSESISELEDERSQNIFRRILKRHTEIAYELQFIRWLDSRWFAEELAQAVSTLLVDKLSKRGFLAATIPGYVRIHDLVFNSIQIEVVVEEDKRTRLGKRVAAFIRRQSQGESDHTLLQRLARMHEQFFIRLAGESREPEFIYMIAMRRAGSHTIDLLDSPVAMADALSAEQTLTERTLDLRVVIEVVEALFTLRREYRQRGEARIRLKEDIRALTLLLKHPSLSQEQRTILQYHHAKMLPRLDDVTECAGRDEAVRIFHILLREDPSYAAARNQLAKLLPAAESIVASEQVLRQHEEHTGTVSFNIVLDSFRLLIRHGANMSKHENLLMATIEYAKGIDLSEAVRLVVSVGQRAWFNAPHLLVPMFNALDLSPSDPAQGDAFDRAQVYKFAASESSDEDRSRLMAEAVRLYRQARPATEYQCAHYADALVRTGQWQEALDVLRIVPLDRRGAFWWQRNAEALSGLNVHQDALSAIKRAIEELSDHSLLPDFLWTKSRIHRAAGHGGDQEITQAIKDLPLEHPFRRKLVAYQGEHHRGGDA